MVMDLRKPYTNCFLSPMKPTLLIADPVWMIFLKLTLRGDRKPVFTGHYCLPPYVPKISGKVACLDGCNM